MKAVDIKTAFKLCTGIKRKRDDEPNPVNTETKVSKISKTEDVNADPDQSVCNGNLNASSHSDDSVVSRNLKTDLPDDSKSVGSVDNVDSSAAAVETEKSKLDDSNKEGNTSKENNTGDDEASSSVVSDDSELNSSAMNQSFPDVSVSSIDICADDQFSKPVEEEVGVNASVEESMPKNLATCDNASEILDKQKPKKKKRMTPEEAKLRTELRAERKRERELKRLEIQARKEKKELERKLAQEEKQKKKEMEEQLKKEKKRQEELQKEEKNRLKQMALEAKAEEKRKKEEQKQKAVEEKLKAVEEKRKAEEEKKKAEEEKTRLEQERKRKAKEAFANFFVRSGTSVSQALPQNKEVIFLPFQVTEGMTLAPAVPSEALERLDKEVLDQHLDAQDCQDLYLSKLNSGQYKSLRSEKKPLKKDLCENEVIVISNNDVPEPNLKAKLLQFCENLRPAYWGTWRKKSKKVLGRNPFAKDEILDYEVDSDDEWDEGGPGESLTGTEEEESEDDYEVDNEFFVPHGYLSAEEEGEDDDENRAPTDPEELKMRLKMKEKEFLRERKKRTTELKPVILGCFFEADGAEDIIAVEKSLMPYSVEILMENNILTARMASNFQNSDGIGPLSLDNSPKNEDKSNIKRPVPEEGMPFLIKLLHANTNSRLSLIKEFQVFWSNHCKKHMALRNLKVSKRQLDFTIWNISSWIKSPDPNFKKLCWWVKEEIRQKYDCVDVPVPNQWNYVSFKDITNTPAPKTADEIED